MWDRMGQGTPPLHPRPRLCANGHVDAAGPRDKPHPALPFCRPPSPLPFTRERGTRTGAHTGRGTPRLRTKAPGERYAPPFFVPPSTLVHQTGRESGSARDNPPGATHKRGSGKWRPLPCVRRGKRTGGCTQTRRRCPPLACVQTRKRPSPPFAPSDPACAQRGTNRDRGNGKGCLHPFPPPCLFARRRGTQMRGCGNGRVHLYPPNCGQGDLDKNCVCSLCNLLVLINKYTLLLTKRVDLRNHAL